MGVHEPIAENIAILQSRRAVRVRTVFRRLGEERLNLERVLQVKAISTNPNPGDLGDELRAFMSEDEAHEQSGSTLPDTLAPRVSAARES